MPSRVIGERDDRRGTVTYTGVCWCGWRSTAYRHRDTGHIKTEASATNEAARALTAHDRQEHS